MIKRRRGRAKKLDPIRGEDVANENLVNSVSSVFDDFDHAALDAVSHQDVLGDEVLGSLVDTVVNDLDTRVQNSSGKYVSEIDELPVTRLASMTPSSVGNQQALLSEKVIDTLVDSVIKRLAERDISVAQPQQLPVETAVDDCNRPLSESSSMLGTFPQKEQASSNALHHRINSEIRQQGRLLRTEQTTHHQDYEYAQLELSRAKTVIAEVMGMHAAAPFNTPVDPFALPIPEYFDIVDTPMDFGTIYNNIEKGLKYKNSEDVLKDVEHIWKSCKQYYSEGDHIMDLMELVKKNFIKYWIAAGLHNKIERHGAANRAVATEAPAHATVSNTVHLQQDAFYHQQPLQPHQVYRQSDQPDYGAHQPQLPLPRDNLQTDCSDSAVRLLHEDQKLGGHDACGLSDNAHDQSGAEPHQGTDNYDRTLYSCSISEEESPAHHLANNDMSCLDPTIESLDNPEGGAMIDNPEEGGAMIDNPILGNSSPNYSQNDDTPQSYPLPSVGDADVSGKKKRTRGPTKCLYVWSRRDDKRIAVPINKLGEPIGPKAAKLSNFLGTIARDGKLVPLSYITWKKVPADVQENIWQLVQSKFVLDPEIRGWVFRNLSTKFANWKAHLKAKHYNPHQTDEERLSDRDKRVLPDQWQDLINFWNSDESQKQSERNKANRSKVKFCHTSGTKSFARLSDERAISNGKEPTKAELFILTRTRKDGQPVNESSSMAISQLWEKMAQLPETVQSDDCADEILYETIGQNKRNRTRISRRAETLTIASEIKKAADEEVSQMRQKMELMEQKYKHMETLMNKILSNIDTSSTNEQVGMPATMAIEESSAPGSPTDQAPAEEAADVPESSEIHPRKRLKATWTS